MAQHSGFFNAVLSNGAYDRTYNADDYSDNLAVVISDGVLRSANDDLKPTASGMEVNIGIGRAWIRGKWYKNDTTYNMVVPTASTANPRKDCVFLRFDNTVAVRNIFLYYAEGKPSANPLPPEPENSDNVRDLVLCEIDVPVNATSVTVTDMRGQTGLCDWVYSVVGNNAFFASLDANFNSWLQEKKDTLASLTLFKQYVWQGVTVANQKQVAFDIPQYDPTGVDILHVYINGLLLVDGVDYTVSDRVVSLATAKSAGQTITVICFKSIDGTGLGTVADEVTALQNKVNTLGDISDYNYITTGTDDNIALSNIAQAFLSGADDGRTLTVHVYGKLGVTSPYSGTGSAVAPFIWFKLGADTNTSRRICFDFGNCERVDIYQTDGTYNRIFGGYNVHVKYGKFRAYAYAELTTGNFFAFENTAGAILAEKMVISIYGYAGCMIASNGTYYDCSMAVYNVGDVARCFIVASDATLKIYGGNYFAYASAGRGSAVILVNTGVNNAAVATFGMTCPQIARSGYSQGHAIYDLAGGGTSAYFGTITPLTVAATGQTVVGTIPQNKTTHIW